MRVLFKLPDAFQDIREHQQADTEIAQLIKALKARRADNALSIVDGVLVHKTLNQTKPRVVIPKRLLPMLFKHYHEAPTAGHLSIAKTLHRVQAYFWSKKLNTELGTW